MSGLYRGFVVVMARACFMYIMLFIHSLEAVPVVTAVAGGR